MTVNKRKRSSIDPKCDDSETSTRDKYELRPRKRRTLTDKAKDKNSTTTTSVNMGRRNGNTKAKRTTPVKKVASGTIARRTSPRTSPRITPRTKLGFVPPINGTNLSIDLNGKGHLSSKSGAFGNRASSTVTSTSIRNRNRSPGINKDTIMSSRTTNVRRKKVNTTNVKKTSSTRAVSRKKPSHLPPRPIPISKLKAPTRETSTSSKTKRNVRTPEIISDAPTAPTVPRIVIHVHDSDDEEEEEKVVKEKRRVNDILITNSETRKSSCFGRILSFLLYITFLTFVVVALLDEHLEEIEELDSQFKTQLETKKLEYDKIEDMYNTSQDKLQSKVKELKQSQSNEILCEKTTKLMEQEINELTRNSANLSNDLEETRKKLSFMTGSEEDIRHSLNGAWKEIESLTEEKNHLSDLHTNCDHSVGILSTEKANAEYRIVELEFALDDAGTNLKSLQSTYEEEKSNRMAIHMELINTQEKVDVLEDQLDREDGRAWYYQLQIKHLEEIIDEQSNTIEDLRYWNHELKDEKKSLKITLDSQVDEAVSALNAVARSATVRKAQQLLEKDNILMIEKDAMMEQAAFAVQAVAGYDKKKRKTEQDQ